MIKTHVYVHQLSEAEVRQRDRLSRLAGERGLSAGGARAVVAFRGLLQRLQPAGAVVRHRVCGAGGGGDCGFCGGVAVVGIS